MLYMYTHIHHTLTQTHTHAHTHGDKIDQQPSSLPWEERIKMISIYLCLKMYAYRNIKNDIFIYPHDHT